MPRRGQPIRHSRGCGDPLNARPTSRFTSGSCVPIKLTVALLKDRRGVIDINLPVTVTLDDLDSPAQAKIKAVGKAQAERPQLKNSIADYGRTRAGSRGDHRGALAACDSGIDLDSPVSLDYYDQAPFACNCYSGNGECLHAATTARSPRCRMPTSPEVRGGERLLKTCSSASKAPSKSGAEHGRVEPVG